MKLLFIKQYTWHFAYVISFMQSLKEAFPSPPKAHHQYGGGKTQSYVSLRLEFMFLIILPTLFLAADILSFLSLWNSHILN